MVAPQSLERLEKNPKITIKLLIPPNVAGMKRAYILEYVLQVLNHVSRFTYIFHVLQEALLEKMEIKFVT